MSAFLTQQSSRLSIALDHIRADARMGRAPNMSPIEEIQREYEAEVQRLEEDLAGAIRQMDDLQAEVDRLNEELSDGPLHR